MSHSEATQVLAGLSALVTGGGSSIGLASARYLVRDGASVLIAGRDVPKLERAAASLRREAASEAHVAWAVADVTQEDDLVNAFKQASDMPGRFAICVASAGGAVPTPFLAGSAADFRAVVELNLVGSYLTFKHAAQAMIDAGSDGSCIAVSSTSAVVTNRGLAAYCASKAGLDMLVQVAADELGSERIRVNGVRPGLTKREAKSPIFGDPALLDTILKGTPLGRTGIPDDTAAMVRFLAGPESSWITGQCLTIDGGSTLRGGADLTSSLPRFAALAATDSKRPDDRR
jgi:NAD(P)-dependent dehydrogenase (short-subunit alcohol dehydrogenase family)